LKHNDGDWEERKKWDEYMAAYNDVFKASDMPWQMIPADHEWYRDYVAAEQFLAVLKTLPLKYPTLSAEIKKKYLG
jgi:polyphosphate kinase 2 (PPK2 family)